MELLDRSAIADIEPNVALINGAWRNEEIVATGTPDDYCAVDFQALAQAFSSDCVRLDRHTSKQITQLFSTKVDQIRKDGPDYVLETNRGLLKARALVVCAGGHSLLMAQAMGLGLEYSCMPVAGSFYFAPEALNGKVYTVQNPSLPFAAVHGDHDIKERGKTRFGPTAFMLPMLERYNRATIPEFFKVLRFDRQVAKAFWGMLKERDIRHYILRNLLYEIPVLNRRLFVREIQKIVPSIAAADISYAEGFGGVRPQLIDKQSGQLRMGEAKIANGAGLIFNMTPSPGGTSCLGSGESDMRSIAAYLGARIDEQAFARELLMGYEDTRAHGTTPLVAEPAPLAEAV
jgi:malate dehydrogenase (quinone)